MWHACGTFQELIGAWKMIVCPQGQHMAVMVLSKAGWCRKCHSAPHHDWAINLLSATQNCTHNFHMTPKKNVAKRGFMAFKGATSTSGLRY